MAPINRNPVFNPIALAQGIEIGSQAWDEGGNHDGSGTTGTHYSYGWRQDYKVAADPLYVRKVFANQCARRDFYDDAPLRGAKGLDMYNGAGRPVGWVPEDLDPAGGMDLANGRVRYQTSSGPKDISSGLDFQHTWLDPLFAVMDAGAGKSVLLGGGFIAPADWLARIVAQYKVATLAGIVRQLFAYVEGGRGTARILDTAVQAGKRGLVSPADAQLFTDWFAQEALPQLERAPGVANVKGSGRCNAYQELGWMIPPLWDALTVLPTTALQARALAVLKVRCQWMLDIEEIAGAGIEMNQLTITQALRDGMNGKTLPTLKGAIVEADVSEGGISPFWSVRACDVVRRVLPGPAAEKLCARAIPKSKALATKLHEKAWLVGADRDWL